VPRPAASESDRLAPDCPAHQLDPKVQYVFCGASGAVKTRQPPLPEECTTIYEDQLREEAAKAGGAPKAHGEISQI
jgi:hypothetical protein